jgi:hypothetical protein
MQIPPELEALLAYRQSLIERLWTADDTEGLVFQITASSGAIIKELQTAYNQQKQPTGE